MPKPKRSTETLVAAIETQLNQIREDGGLFAVALWSEADANAGYVLHVDGRMVGIGEYQYGFSTVRELLDEPSDEESRQWARSEAGRIAGDMEALDLEDVAAGRDDYGLMETFPNAFMVDSDTVEEAIREGKASFEQLFELLMQNQAAQLCAGLQGYTHDIVPTRDVQVGRVERSEDGGLVRRLHTVAQAGQTLQGCVHGERAFVNVEGGYATLDEHQFQATPVAPVRRPHC